MENFLRDYMTMLKVERNLARNSLESYERDLQQYHQYLKTELKLKTIRNVTLGHIRSFVRKLSNRGLAANSIKRAVSSIRTYHNFLSAEGHMKDNPAQLLDTPKIPRKLPNVLTIQEIDKILGIIPENALEALNIVLKRAGTVPVWLEPCTLSLARTVSGDEASVVFIKDGRSVRALFFFGGTIHAFGHPIIRNGIVSMDSITGDQGLVSTLISMINEKPRSTKSPTVSIKFMGQLPGKWKGFISSKKRYLQQINPLDSFTLAKNAKLNVNDPSDFGEVAGLLHRRIM